MLNTKNQAQKLPIILTGPVESKAYFEEIDAFIGATLGEKAQSLYEIIIGDSEKVAKTLKVRLEDVLTYRKEIGDSYHFNWSLVIEPDFQRPFEPDHESMANQNISFDQETSTLAANLRRIFSGIVAGNVKASGIKEVREKGPFDIKGDPKIMALMDKLLKSFVEQERMKLPGTKYQPCYRVIGE